jgi:hypothetical protein
MELTPTEAFALLRRVARQADEARAAWDAARALRDDLILQFDGQEGMSRALMADACGITRMALWKMVDRRPEGVEEDVLLSDALRRAIEDAIGAYSLPEDARGRLALDVHA